jgi:predicted molibdopterin-dependent oxidoreductase YjgC
VFGAGGGTSSYKEMEDTDLVILWGSNAREAHPIFFHHVLKAVHRGAPLYVVDPRRTSSAQWADQWLGLDVGTDIALSNTMAREIIHAGLANQDFITRATTGFVRYAAAVEPWTLARGEMETGVPATVIREVAHAYAKAPTAQLCWTLGITEHHNAVDNVLALINLALLCGHVGRHASGLNPLRGQNNVQGGGDMGAIPNKLAGFQDIESNHDARARFEAAWECTIEPRYGRHLTQMFHGMEAGTLTAVYVMGENPAQSEADIDHARALLRGLDHLVVQDLFLTKTAEMADVVLPASAAWCESDGTVTNSERRVQRVRKAVEPPGDARDDLWILTEMARRMGRNWPDPVAETIWDELRSLSPMHRGMSYARIEELGGIQWPCYDDDTLEPSYLHGRLWAEDPIERGEAAPFSVVEQELPVDELTADYPLRLTTGRRLDSYNTGVQTAGYASPLRFGETVDLSPEDADSLGVVDGEVVAIASRRGRIEAPVRVDAGLRAGLVFMTMHFPDQVDTNRLTIEAVCPKSGTAEFKAAAIRVEKIRVAMSVRLSGAVPLAAAGA